MLPAKCSDFQAFRRTVEKLRPAGADPPPDSSASG
jgi:hypothetical protein